MTSLRVGTFNIRHGRADDGPNSWEYRRTKTIAVLRELSLDIAGLQEAFDFQLEEILAELPQLRAIGVGRDDGARAGEYAAIVFDPSRLAVRESGTFWFSSTPEVAGTADWGNVNVRICTWGQFEDQASGLGFVLFNVHLDHESAPSRMKSAELLVERIRQESAGFPTIVTGDFNADEQDPCIQILRDAGFRDSYRVLHPDVSDVGTFHGFSGAYMPEKIDYIWVDPAWSVRDAEVVRSLIDGGTPSDHAPVTATLEFCEAKMME